MDKKKKDVIVLNKILESNILAQDEQHMVQTLKQHYLENQEISQQLDKNIQAVTRNIKNVQSLCNGDSTYEQQLTTELTQATAILSEIRSRVAPLDELKSKYSNLNKEFDKLTHKDQDEEMELRKIINQNDSLKEALQEQHQSIYKLNDTTKFKGTLRKHLKRNLVLREEMIQNLETSSSDLSKKFTSINESFKKEQHLRGQHLNDLRRTASNVEQQYNAAVQRYDSEKFVFDGQLQHWREQARLTIQHLNDIRETLQKGELKSKLLQSQLERHIGKHKLLRKRFEEARDELDKTNSEIEDTRNKIDEFALIPQSHLNIVNSLKEENSELEKEIENLTKLEEESREQAAKLTLEIKELECVDEQTRRKNIDKRLAALRTALITIDSAVKASESSYTCFECLKCVRQPMTFVPCGHSVCRKHGKHATDVLVCPECKASCDIVFANTIIPEMLSKLQYLHSIIAAALEN
ncbi:hypothetical protein GPJ56_009520 [Histomonas meleagridis]|uniref:uncharacterized protein n=1 Tax=Histomonas meleagridis TaxID=135588 RepID=UPI00355A099D|nr:hypothetical protein GPJ56_009520 [Histomonas meleagridis]KAH0802916.1 hypothetical protein GO595_004423 [Histomonas meleagridis]